MASKKPETTLQEAIQDAARARGAYCVKINGGPYQPDTIDLVICYRGRFVGLEAKILGNEATPRQAKRLREISAAGGRASVVYSVSDAMKVLDEIDEEVQEWLTWRNERTNRVRAFGLPPLMDGGHAI